MNVKAAVAASIVLVLAVLEEVLVCECLPFRIHTCDLLMAASCRTLATGASVLRQGLAICCLHAHFDVSHYSLFYS